MALKDDANELKDIFNNLNSELDKTLSKTDFSEGLDKSKDSILSIADAARQLTEYQSKQNDLTSSQLKDLQNKVETEQKSLSSQLDSLQNQKQLNQELQQSNKEEIKRIQGNKKIENLLQLERSEIKKIIKENKELEGIQGGQTASIENIAKLLGKSADEVENLKNGLKDAAKSEEKIEKHSGKLAEQGKKIKDGFNKMFDGPMQSLMGMLNPLALIGSLIGGLVEAGKDYDKSLGDTAKSMGITYNEAEKSAKAMDKFAQSSGSVLLNTRDIGKTINNLNASLGTQVKFEEMGTALKEDVALMTKLQNASGLTADETKGIFKFSRLTGKNVEDTAKQIMKGYKVRGLESKLMLNEKDAMKEISKLSAATQLSISGGAEGLGRAMAAAKALGSDLSKMESASSSLLNFEQSIADELEAELLTGKELNLEKARQAALDGELGDLATALSEQGITAAEFSGMNVIAQESIAKAMGMQRNDLGEMLSNQEALKDLSADSVEQLYEREMLGKSEEERQSYLNSMGDESLSRQLEQLSIQEEKNLKEQKFNEEQIIANTQMEKIRGTMVTVFDTATKIVNAFGGLKGIMIIIGGLMTAKLVKGTYQMLAGITASIAAKRKQKSETVKEAAAEITSANFKTFGAIPVVGAILAAAAAATGIGLLMSSVNSVKDGVIDPKGGIMLSGEKGSIQLDKDDSVVAGTNLFGGKKGGSSQNSQSQGSMDISSVVAAINTLSAKVEAMANRPINVGIDGKKVIEAGTGNNPNTFGEEVGKNSFALQ